MTLRNRFRFMFSRLFVFLSILGPGLITASGDNDAPGIAAYSMAGSKYGYTLLWVILVITLGEIVVQEMAARMGVVTGKGLADLIRERFGVKITFFSVVVLMIANFGTTVAQFAGIAAATELLGLSRYLSVPLAAVLLWVLVVRNSYDRIEKVFLGLTLYALAYIITVFLVGPDWGEVLRNTVVPTIQWDTQFFLVLLAIIGTTITPWGCVYLQASIADKGVDIEHYEFTRLDVVTGATLGNIVSAFMIICTAATLYPRGIHVESAEEAAMALIPLAGEWARYLFGIGLLGASLLAASVLPLSTSYAVCEAFGWERGVDNQLRKAPMFFGLYTGMIVLGTVIVLVPGIPLFPLMWLSQSLNAVLIPVILVLMLKLVNDHRIMGKWTNSRLGNVLAWGMTAFIALSTVVMLLSSL
jgi:Mn2+/Fe2+ NRAMP family transporter